LPSETGDDKTKMSKVESKELGRPAIEIQLLDTFGQSKASVADWTGFSALRLDRSAFKEVIQVDVALMIFKSGLESDQHNKQIRIRSSGYGKPVPRLSGTGVWPGSGGLVRVLRKG
jgi:hypothetical protein